MGQNSSSPRNRGRSLNTVPRSQNNSTSPNQSRFSPAPPIVQQPSRHNFAFQPLTQDQRSHLMNILPNAVVIEQAQPLNMPQRQRVTSLERGEIREIRVNRSNEVDDFMTTFLNIKEVNRAVDFSQKMMELKMMENGSAGIHRDPCLTFNLEEVENNLKPNPMDFNEQLALATDFNSFSSRYVTMVETYEETREKVAERKVLEDGRTRKKVTNTQAYRKISAGDISLREVVYNGNSNAQLQNKIGGDIISSKQKSLELSGAKIIKTTQLRPAPLMDERSYQGNVLENNTSINKGMMDSRRGSQKIEDQNMKGYESNKFVNPILNSHNSSLSSIPNRKTSAFAQNKEKTTIQNISNLNIDLSPSLTSLDQLAQQISSKNSPQSRGEKDVNTSLVRSQKNAPIMTPRGSNHTIPQRNPVYSPKRSDVTSPERKQEEHNFFASLVGQKPMSRKMTKESEPKEEKSMNLGQGKGYMGQIMKSPPPHTSGRYGQKTQYFQHVFKNNANLSPKGLWEEEKSFGNGRSLRDVDETWETRETQKENQKASTSIISQRKEKLGEKSFTAGQKSPGRAANLNDSSTSISKAKQGKISTVPVKTKNGKQTSEQVIPTKKFDLSGTQSKKLNKSQLEDKKSPNTSQIREKPYPDVLRLPSNSDKETSKMDQTRSDKQFSERSDSDAVPKTEGEQDFQQPLEVTLDLSAFVIPRTGNNTSKAADHYSGFDDDFFKENPFQVQNKKSSGESDGAENNRSQYGRQGGGGEDLNKSNTSSRGQNQNSKMIPQKNKEKAQINKENMYEVKGSNKNIDVSETSLDNIDDQELISEVREKLWNLSNKLQTALSSKHAYPENDFEQPKSGLSPRNPNVENQRKMSREEHVQNLKFFPYQNDCLFADKQNRSPVARRPSTIFYDFVH